MTKIANTQTASPAVTQRAASAKSQPAAPAIAVRKRCNPDGIGLSHYVLMDRKAAQ